MLYSCELADLWAEANDADWPAAIAALDERLDPDAVWPPAADALEGDEPNCVFCNEPVSGAQLHRADLYDNSKEKAQLLFMLPCHKDCFIDALHVSLRSAGAAK